MAPPTYYLVCLHEKCSQTAAQFIADCLRKPTSEGGSELIIHQEEMRPNGLIMHVTASNQKILELAETIGIKKPDKQGIMRDFQVANAKDFEETGRIGPLTLSDIHRCILYAMESVHFEKSQKSLPGHDNKKVMSRAPILSAYREAGFIDTFPLHDDEEIDKLGKMWVKGGLFRPPVQEIRDYFGENVALYFSFTTFYTRFLIPMAAFGIVHFILDRYLGIDVFYSNVAFSFLNLISVTIFLEMWKRRSNDHSYYWGTGGKLRHKRPRPEFRGELGINKITGREEMQYPMKKTLRRLIFVSIPITLFCLLLAFFLMLGSFQLEHWVHHKLEGRSGIVSTVLGMVPSVGYSILVHLMNQYYLHLAHFLSEWENHRTQEQFERHVVSKLILFEFVNTFLSLFYIAFYMQNIPMLKSQVFSMLITSQIVNQVQESLLPIVLKRPSTRRVLNKVSKKLVKDKEGKGYECHHCEVSSIDCISKEDSRIAVANFSLARDPYESTYDDFMELWLQFGHVFLFSSVYPLAAFFALINNLLELKLDAYKMSRLTRKPTPRAVRDIGAWYLAFSVTSAISVMTNCALLAMDPSVQAVAPEASTRDWILLFVAIEHIFLFIRLAIEKGIPDETSKVKEAMDRDEFVLKSKKKVD